MSRQAGLILGPNMLSPGLLSHDGIPLQAVRGLLQSVWTTLSILQMHLLGVSVLQGQLLS